MIGNMYIMYWILHVFDSEMQHSEYPGDGYSSIDLIII